MTTVIAPFRDYLYEQTGITFSEDSYLNMDHLEVEKHPLQDRYTFLGKRTRDDEEEDQMIRQLMKSYTQPRWQLEPLIFEIVDKPKLTVFEGSSNSETIFQYIFKAAGKTTPARPSTPPRISLVIEQTPEPRIEPELDWTEAEAFLPVKKIQVQPEKVEIKEWTQEEKFILNAKKNINRHKKIAKKLADKARAEAKKAAKELAKQQTRMDYSNEMVEEGVTEETQEESGILLESLQKCNLKRQMFVPHTKQILRTLPPIIEQKKKKFFFKIEYGSDSKSTIPHPMKRKWIYHRSLTSSAVFDRLCLELVRRIMRVKVVRRAQVNYCRGCHAFIFGPASKLGKLHDFNEKFRSYFNINAVNYRLCTRKVKANLAEDPNYYKERNASKLFPESKDINRLQVFATSNFRYELKMLNPIEVQDEMVENMKSFLRDAGDWQRYEYSGNKLKTRDMMPVPWYCTINNSLPLRSGLVDRCFASGDFTANEKHTMLIEDEVAKRQQE